MHKQRGFTFWGMAMTVTAIIIIALITIKLFPAYTEYLVIKKAIVQLGNDASLTSKTDIQKAFEKAATIDNIKSVNAADLEVSVDAAGHKVISVEYQVVVPLVANVSALLDFYATSDGSTPDAE